MASRARKYPPYADPFDDTDAAIGATDDADFNDGPEVAPMDQVGKMFYVFLENSKHLAEDFRKRSERLRMEADRHEAEARRSREEAEDHERAAEQIDRLRAAGNDILNPPNEEKATPTRKAR